MGIYIRVTDRALLDAISATRGAQDTVTARSVLEQCPEARCVHFHDGKPVGLLLDLQIEVPEYLRVVGTDIVHFGKPYHLCSPNRRTLKGKSLGDSLEMLHHTTTVARYALQLIGPRIRSKLRIDEFGFDYCAQARLHFIGGQIYIALAGISLLTNVYDLGSGVELISRDAYRAAVKQSQHAVSSLLFTHDDPLVAKTQAALAPFLPLELPVVNALLSDIYHRVCVEPDDVKHYLPYLLFDRELTYVFTTIVGILHAFYGHE